jgi:hypothetical protein
MFNKMQAIFRIFALKNKKELITLKELSEIIHLKRMSVSKFLIAHSGWVFDS